MNTNTNNIRGPFHSNIRIFEYSCSSLVRKPYCHLNVVWSYGYMAEGRPYDHVDGRRPYGHVDVRRPYDHVALGRPYVHVAVGTPYGDMAV